MKSTLLNATPVDNISNSIIDDVRCPSFRTADLHSSILGVQLAVPEWEAIITVIVLSSIIIFTIIGNVLVILSVFTYKPLRIVQNFFIVSLAVADLTVAILVLPFNVAYSILGRWEFGIHLCKMWLTSDVLCCTSSILNLCAIALDRYWAITDPINYAQKRTVGRVLLLITGVWIISLVISSPPLIGWNDWPEDFTNASPCVLTSNKGYVIYSFFGSFFIPLVIMTSVYIEIFIATKRRLRERSRASRINEISMKSPSDRQKQVIRHDDDSISSELNNTEINENSFRKQNRRKEIKILKTKDSIKVERSKQYCDLMLPKSHVDTANAENSSDNNRQNDYSTCHDTTGADIASKRSNGLYQFIEEKQKISLSKERRAARTLGIIMGVFVMCWLPFFLMYVILPFCNNCCPTEKFKNFLTWLGYINSGLNPIIYTIFNLDYRRAFKRLLGIEVLN